MKVIPRLILTTLMILPASAAAQTTSTRYAPPDFDAAWEAVTEFRETARKANVGGTVNRVRWSDDGRYLSYRVGRETMHYDLQDRAFVQSLPAEAKADSDDAQSSGRRRPARGRQRTSEKSPDGSMTARSADWNVMITDEATGAEIPVTLDGHRKLRYGTASWVYGEELDQNDAMWWSADSRYLAFYKFDESPVRDFYLTGDLTKTNTTNLIEGYPKAGAANPIAALMVYDSKSGNTVDVHVGLENEQYIYNVRFAPNDSILIFNRTNRHQNHLNVMAADPATGASRVILTETQETWQENAPTMRFLDDGRRFIWKTERSGWANYELRTLDSDDVITLTAHNFPVSGIEGIDEQYLYYTAYANQQNPLNNHLFRVALDGASPPQRLTGEPYNHSVDLSPEHRYFITRYQAVNVPPTTALYTTEGERIATLASPDSTRLDEITPWLPELFSFIADDGETQLYGTLYRPPDFDPDRSYPLILNVYGGPHAQLIRNTWRPIRSETALGFCYATIDNRGTPNRGKAFEAATYLKLGIVDIKDQVDGVKHLIANYDFIDGDRVGIVGHSYGGYMAALGILKYPDVFHAAVARAAVTDWRNYDTIYTERYMRTPQENTGNYDAGSTLTYAEDLKGHLLIMHGMVDDNVHPNNAWQLIDKLDTAGKRYESRFFPRAGHGFGGRDTQWEFLYRHLIQN